MGILQLAVLAFVFAAGAVAGDAEEEVTKKVLAAAERQARDDHQAPCAFAGRTSGGADLFVREWSIQQLGRAIGNEIADAWARVNSESGSLNEQAVAERRVIELNSAPPSETDWTAIDAAYPGTGSVVVLSRPAFDRHQSIAVMRADFYPRTGVPTTTVYRLERHPSGSWKVGPMATASLEAMHDAKAHLHQPDDAGYYHARE